MNLYTNNDWSVPQRQPLIGLVILFYKAVLTVLKAVWPIILVTLFRNKSKGFDAFEIMLIIISAFILLRSLFEFFYFRFYIVQNELIIKKGFLSKKTLTIPLERIQSVNLEQSLLHQALKVVKVKIDTAGSEKTEATIDTLDNQKAESLKAFLLQNYQITTTEIQAPPPVEVPVIRLSYADLFKLGLSANHIHAFFIVLAFAISMVQNLEEVFGNRVIAFVKESSSIISVTINSILILIVIVLLISVIVSLVRITLTYFDFYCSETTHGFRIQSGLLNTRQNLVPFSKIQYISWDANWVRRRIGIYNLELHQALGDDASRKQRVKIPITRPSFIERLIRRYHNDIRKSADSQHRIHSVYPYRRTLLIALPVAGCITAITFFWLQQYAFLFLLLIPYIFVTSYLFRRNFRLYVAPEALQVYSGVWGRETKIVQWYKIQEVLMQQSIYQRRKSLADIELHTAGGTISIPFISLELARIIQNYAMYKVESATKKWM